MTIDPQTSPSTADRAESVAASRVLQLGSNNEIHCGPENSLLRHSIEQFNLGHLDSLVATWTPLLVYGEPASGKTMIARCWAEAWPLIPGLSPPVVITAADLIRGLRRTALAEDIEAMSRQLRDTALMVVDDIQLLASKPHAVQWFSHLLDYRHREQLPSVLTCSGTLASAALPARLHSRVVSGLAVRMALPLSATRAQIVRQCWQRHGHAFDDAAVQEAVEQTNNQSVAATQMAATQAMHPELRELQNETTVEPVPAELAQSLIRVTARRFGVKVGDLRGASRRKHTVLARAVAMYLIRQLSPLSLAETGKYFRNRDHTTVRHACRKIAAQLHGDAQLREAIVAICDALPIRTPSHLLEPLDDCA